MANNSSAVASVVVVVESGVHIVALPTGIWMERPMEMLDIKNAPRMTSFNSGYPGTLAQSGTNAVMPVTRSHAAYTAFTKSRCKASPVRDQSI